jgi:hypothetical protein
MGLDTVSLTLLGSATKVAFDALRPLVAEQFKGKPVTRKQARGAKINLTDSELSSGEVQRTLELVQQAREPSPSLLSISRKMGPGDAGLEQSPEQRQIGALALAISPQAVFSDARQRMELVFKINLAVAIVLAVILLGGLAGSVYSAIFLHNNIWASVFGGVSAADVIGLLVFKPLTAINTALIGTQRLEMLQLRLSQQLDACALHERLDARIECQSAVWDTIQRELGLLAAKS